MRGDSDESSRLSARYDASTLSFSKIRDPTTANEVESDLLMISRSSFSTREKTEHAGCKLKEIANIAHLNEVVWVTFILTDNEYWYVSPIAKKTKRGPEDRYGFYEATLVSSNLSTIDQRATGRPSKGRKPIRQLIPAICVDAVERVRTLTRSHVIPRVIYMTCPVIMPVDHNAIQGLEAQEVTWRAATTW